MKHLCAWSLASLVLVAAPSGRADPVRDAQWFLDYLNVGQVHSISEGSGVTVAVIDTGVDANHPDLAGTLGLSTDLTIDGGDGRTDADGHGTHMAGLIAGHGRALGIAPRATVMSVRAMQRTVGGSFGPAAVDWAVDHGAKVICMAAGGPDTAALRRSISKALDKGIVVVAAAGNVPTDTRVAYPAAYSGVVAAGGVDRTGNHASVAVSGPEVVLAAPAMDIVGPDRTGPGLTGYSTGDGTSDATAIIAGAAALVRSKFPNLSGPEVVHRLTATADDKGAPGRDVEYGYGVLNIVKALTADVPPLTAAPSARPIETTNQTQPPPAKDDTSGVLLIVGGVVLLLLIGAAGVLWQRVRR